MPTSSLILVALSLTLIFLGLFYGALCYFQNYTRQTERYIYYQRVWTNYFWWNRELMYAVMINFSPNTHDILSEVYSCIDHLRLPSDITVCFKQMIRCQIVVMQHPNVSQFVEEWKFVARKLGLMMAPQIGHVLFQAQVDILLQQMKYLKVANPHHIHAHQQQLLETFVPMLASLCVHGSFLE